MISPDAILGSHAAFCSGDPAITRPCDPIPTLVPKLDRKAGVVRTLRSFGQKACRKGRVGGPTCVGPFSPRDFCFPGPAVFLGDRQAEQAHLLHLGDYVARDRVVLLALSLERPDPFG